MPNDDPKQTDQSLANHLQGILDLLDEYELEDELPQGPMTPRHELVEPPQRKQQESDLQRHLDNLHAADVADILERIPVKKRKTIWGLVTADREGEILLHLSDAVRQSLIDTMEPNELISATGSLESDEIADLAPDLPKSVMKGVLESLNDQQRLRVQSVLQRKEDSVAALMDFGMITIREDLKLKTVLRYLRRLDKLPENTDKLFVVDRNHVLTGILPINSLLFHGQKTRVADIMSTDFVSFRLDADANEAAHAFERYDLLSAPVVDENNRLQGRVCVDEIVDFFRQESDEDIRRQAGLIGEEDLFSSVWSSAKNRWVWLMLNIVTAFLATRIIGLFEKSIIQIVALASLMPIVAAIGGNTGNQTSVLVVRALALGQISRSNVRLLITKELLIGLLNGIVWGSVIGIIVYYLYSNLPLGLVMASAVFLNLFLASLVGVSIPLLRHKIGSDPALGTSVLLTFMTDSMGFFIFLSLATFYLI